MATSAGAPADLGPGEILLAWDGEPQTIDAARWALTLASALGRRLQVVFVKDPYLKQFHNEIYAQGRQAYLDHVDRCNEDLATEARVALEGMADGLVVEWEYRVRDGDPAEELTAEAASGTCALVVAGARRATGRWHRRPRGLGRKLAASLDLPVLVVPASE